jgi:hypothetical protein
LNGTGACALRVISSKAGASFSDFLQMLDLQYFLFPHVLTQSETDACVLTRTGSM